MFQCAGLNLSHADGEVPPRARLYWRGLVLSDFDGRSWTQADFYGPDRPILDRRRDVVRTLDAEEGRVVGGPTRGRDLQHPHVVERPLRCIKVGILPDLDQLG